MMTKYQNAVSNPGYAKCLYLPSRLDQILVSGVQIDVIIRYEIIIFHETETIILV